MKSARGRASRRRMARRAARRMADVAAESRVPTYTCTLFFILSPFSPPADIGIFLSWVRFHLRVRFRPLQATAMLVPMS